VLNGEVTLLKGKMHKQSSVGPDGLCSPRHRMASNPLNEDSKRVSMTRRARGLADSARHVKGCHVTPETRVENACHDVASTIHPFDVASTVHQSLVVGRGRHSDPQAAGDQPKGRPVQVDLRLTLC